MLSQEDKNPYNTLIANWKKLPMDICDVTIFQTNKKNKDTCKTVSGITKTSHTFEALQPDTDYTIIIKTSSDTYISGSLNTDDVTGPTLHKYITSYHNDEIIGRGENSIVYKKFHAGEMIAVKRVERTNVNREPDILALLNTNENVIHYKWKETDDKYLYLCFEYCRFNLETYLKKASDLTLEVCVEILREISNGLKFLHTENAQRNIIHRDLKPSNILLSLNDRWKIGDFGISKEIKVNATSTRTRNTIGTKGFMPFESMSDLVDCERKQCEKTDIFSLAVLFYYILTKGHYPFGGDHETAHRNIGDKKEPSFGKMNSLLCRKLRSLLTRMLSHERDRRPCITEVLSHHIFWKPAKKLLFIRCVANFTGSKKILDKMTNSVFTGDWTQQFNALDYPELHKHLTKGKYKVQQKRKKGETTGLADNKSVVGLAKHLRNLFVHFDEDNKQDLREELKSVEHLWKLFDEKFPFLLCDVYDAIYVEKDDPTLKDFYNNFPNERKNAKRYMDYFPQSGDKEVYVD